jgi:hypothetical protein
MAYDLGGYVDVATRLRMALKDWPQLRIQETSCTLDTIGEQSFLVCTITIWRDERDTVPVIASAAEIVPGRTPYTKNSERMVGFTSALGRGLGYMGYGIDKAIASADEVQHKRQIEEPYPTSPQSDAVLEAQRKIQRADARQKTVQSKGPMSDAQRKMIRVQAQKAGIADNNELLHIVEEVCDTKLLTLEELTKQDASRLIERLMQMATEKQTENNN